MKNYTEKELRQLMSILLRTKAASEALNLGLPEGFEFWDKQITNAIADRNIIEKKRVNSYDKF